MASPAALPDPAPVPPPAEPQAIRTWLTPAPGISRMALAALFMLLAAGLILATSFLVYYPVPVIAVAWLIALVGLLTVAVSTWRTSRSTGASWSRTVGQTLKAAGRFILDFF